MAGGEVVAGGGWRGINNRKVESPCVIQKQVLMCVKRLDFTFTFYFGDGAPPPAPSAKVARTIRMGVEREGSQTNH